MPKSIELTNEYIIINNKKMALYMGAIFNIHFDGTRGFIFPNGKVLLRGARDCKYHTCWNWLIPVAVKSYEIIKEESINNPDIDKLMNDILVYHLKRGSIKYIYITLIKFIDYYNKIKEHEITGVL